MEYTALILFILSTSITPGPNNLMIMTSGVNFGLRKSLPHLLGIDIGFPLMLIAVGMGISQLFERVPSLMLWLKILGVIYLTYLAFKIAITPIKSTDEPSSAQIAKPFTFVQALLFQWVNPKAWIMSVGAVATYTVTGSDYMTQIFIISSLFVIFGSPCTVAWLGFGKALKRFLSQSSYQRVFNVCMALVLMASLYPVVGDLLKSSG
jgi:threonine/homoserine/homoserine lactone efflux protein